MTDEIKNEEKLDEGLNNEESIVFDENYSEPKEVLLSEEEIDALSEESLIEYVQRTEYAIDKMELTEIEDDETYELYLNLKKQEKILNKKVKLLTKEIKEKGFFDYIKPWMFIYIILVIVLGIFPINPFLPLLLMTEINDKIVVVDDVLKNILYACYIGILLIPGIVLCACHKRKTKEQRLSQRAFLILLIIATLITAVGVILYILWT